MARAKKTFASAAERKKHEDRLAKRRSRQHEKRTLRMAEEAADGEADFTALVDAEKARIENAKKAGSQSPKVMAAARDDLAAAFDLIGGVAALVVWGRRNPTEFYRIWARLIPKEAAENTQTLPLETLLEKLANKEEKTVAEAAIEIGQETLLAGREQARREDAMLPERPEDIN